MTRRERNKVRMARWRADQPEEYRKYWDEWYAKNGERVRASARIRARSERGRLTSRLWFAAHPGYMHGANLKRLEAMKTNLGHETVTTQHLILLLEAQEGKCRYCRKPLGSDKHLDHRVPISRGGAHAPSNLCWACPRCNLGKGTRTEAAFLLEAR